MITIIIIIIIIIINYLINLNAYEIEIISLYKQLTKFVICKSIFMGIVIVIIISIIKRVEICIYLL